MNRDLELEELKLTLDEYQFSDAVDTRYLRYSIPHAKSFFIHLMNNRYFTRFYNGTQKSPRIVNILELGCNCAPLVFSLRDLEKIFRQIDIYIEFKYLGIDMLKNLMAEMQEKFSKQRNIFFRGFKAENAELVTEAMHNVNMTSVDIVLVRRPVVIGMEWNQWIFPAITSQAILKSALDIVHVVKYHTEQVNTRIMWDFIIPQLTSHFLFNPYLHITGTQYSAFQKILAGPVAQYYENATMVVTNYHWPEKLATGRILRRSYQGAMDYGQFVSDSSLSVPFLSNIYLDYHYTIISRYQYQPSNAIPFPEMLLNSKFLAGILFLRFTKNILRNNETVWFVLLRVTCLSFILMYVPPALEIDYLASPGIALIAPYLSYRAVLMIRNILFTPTRNPPTTRTPLPQKIMLVNTQQPRSSKPKTVNPPSSRCGIL